MRRARLWQVAALSILVLGIAGGLLGSVALYRNARSSDRADLTSAASAASASLASTLGRYTDLVETTASTVSEADPMSRAAFSSYLERLDVGSSYAGVYGIGVVSDVGPGELPAYVATARAQGLADFAVAPAGDRSRYCILGYAQWTDPSKALPILGYDFCSTPWVASALFGALEHGTGLVVPGSRIGAAFRDEFVVAVPVYRGHPTDSSARIGSAIGWVAALVDGRSMVSSALGARATLGLALYAGAPSDQSLVVSVPDKTAPASQRLSSRVTGGLEWTVELWPLSHYRAAQDPRLAWVLLASVAVVAALLAALVWTLGSGRGRALRLVAETTRSLRQSEERFRSLATSSPMGIIEVGGDLEISYCNPRMEEIAGVAESDLLGHGWVERVHADDRSSFLRVARAAGNARDAVSTALRMVRPDGEIRQVRILAAPLPNAIAWPNGYVVTVEDVTAEHAAREALAFQAVHDPLTGLPNRTLFLDRLGQELARTLRSGGALAVLFLDIDRFKVINDSLGHQAGDELLQQVAARLQSVVRLGETVARFGGDEFTFLLRDIEGEDDAVRVAERVLDVLGPPFVVEDIEAVVSGSIGIVLPHAGARPDDVLRDADTAMYRAKKQGRSRWSVFDEAQHHSSVQRLQLETELRRALERGEFEVYYQPQVALDSDEVIGAEALVRWQHPERGLVLPGEFVPVAEETGLIVPLGQWVLSAAAAQLADWDAEAGAPKLASLGVNVSASQLGDGLMLAGAMDIVGERRARLCLEITETIAMADDDLTRRALAHIRAAGFSMAIDDFGTGYASLSYLQRLPVSALKIDRSFVDCLGADKADGSAIVSAVVEMGHSLGLTVVAEGVERPEQRRALVESGCDVAQGFLWSQALPAERFAAWWRRHSHARARRVPVA